MRSATGFWAFFLSSSEFSPAGACPPDCVWSSCAGNEAAESSKANNANRFVERYSAGLRDGLRPWDQIRPLFLEAFISSGMVVASLTISLYPLPSSSQSTRIICAREHDSRRKPAQLAIVAASERPRYGRFFPYNNRAPHYTHIVNGKLRHRPFPVRGMIFFAMHGLDSMWMFGEPNLIPMQEASGRVVVGAGEQCGWLIHDHYPVSKPNQLPEIYPARVVHRAGIAAGRWPGIAQNSRDLRRYTSFGALINWASGITQFGRCGR